MERSHPYVAGLIKTLTQISRYTTNIPPQLFHFFDFKNRDELVRNVSVEHLSFSFGEKLYFLNYYKNALNPQATRVRRITLTRTLHKLYKNEKTNTRFFYHF